MALTQERLRDTLQYDPDIGVFTRRGGPAGCRRSDGVILVSIDGRVYTGHRLAWLFVHGTNAMGRIVHANGDRSDNRISNLAIEGIRKTLTLNRLKSLVVYDPSTGLFERRKGRYSKAQRQTAMAKRPSGYLVLSVDKKCYAAHRLAWFYVYGTWPDEIDHVDGDRANNRIANLRPATRTQNNVNSRLRKDNTSGFKGVSWDVGRGKWTVRVGKRSLGRFNTKEEAIAVRRVEAGKVFGEYLRER